MNLSTQCPDLLVTVSTDQTMKVWDIAEGKPQCVQEKDVKLGRLHCVDQCPDAPFVVAIGGDKSSDNLKVLDVREAAAGKTPSTDCPLGYSIEFFSFKIVPKDSKAVSKSSDFMIVSLAYGFHSDVDGDMFIYIHI